MDCYLFDCFSAADAELMLETFGLYFPLLLPRWQQC
jgi:hypothetical protein